MVGHRLKLRKIRLKYCCENRRLIRFNVLLRRVLSHPTQPSTFHNKLSDSVACQHFVQLSSWYFLSYRRSSASALLTFGVGYLGTLLWCDKHARCVLNNNAECWGRSVFNVFSASLSQAISVDVQQREKHRVQTILSNQESALLYATSSIATACFETHKCVKMSLVRMCSHSQHLWIYDIWLLLLLQFYG